MSFLDTRFPVGISYGSKGGPTWANSVIELPSGASERVQRNTQPRHVFDVRWGLRSLDDFQDIRDLWMQTAGSVHGFRFKDWTDYTTRTSKPNIHIGAHSETDVQLGVGDASTTQFQLAKTYTVGALTFTRTIKKPVSGTVLVSLDDVNQATGWSVDTSTGIVTFTAAPGLGVVVKAGCEFDVPGQFSPGLDKSFKPVLGAFKAASLGAITVEEMLGDTVTPARLYHGGGSTQTISATTALNITEWGSAISLEPTVAATILMPDPTNLEAGTNWHMIENATTNGSFSLTFKTFDGASTLWTLTAGSIAETFIYESGGVNTWGAQT